MLSEIPLTAHRGFAPTRRDMRPGGWVPGWAGVVRSGLRLAVKDGADC